MFENSLRRRCPCAGHGVQSLQVLEEVSLLLHKSFLSWGHLAASGEYTLGYSLVAGGTRSTAFTLGMSLVCHAALGDFHTQGFRS